jgi:hypothetical protein
MGRIPKTKSGRWEVEGNFEDPNAKWVGKEGWRSHPPAEQPSVAQIGKWVEDMADWCEMMHDTVLELRDRVSSIEGLRPKIEQLGQDLYQLDYVVKQLSPPPGSRPAAAEGPLP